MKTKEKLIHEEWIKLIGNEAYQAIKEMINPDGYIEEFKGKMILKDFPYYGKTGLPDWDAKDYSVNDIPSLRPSKISYILKNNGWNLTEDILPDKFMLCEICANGIVVPGIAKFVHLGKFFLHDNYKFSFDRISHWKEFKNSNDPLY